MCKQTPSRTHTPWKIYMEPKQASFDKEYYLPNHHLSVPCWIFNPRTTTTYIQNKNSHFPPQIHHWIPKNHRKKIHPQKRRRLSTSVDPSCLEGVGCDVLLWTFELREPHGGVGSRWSDDQDSDTLARIHSLGFGFRVDGPWGCWGSNKRRTVGYVYPKHWLIHCITWVETRSFEGKKMILNAVSKKTQQVWTLDSSYVLFFTYSF